MILASALLLFLIGTIHSVLGERFILVRLFKRQDIPKLFGSDWFTKRTLRFAWHLTTVAWFGFAGILLVLSNSQIESSLLLKLVSLTFFITGLLAFSFTNGKHLSWIVFWTVSALTMLASL